LGFDLPKSIDPYQGDEGNVRNIRLTDISNGIPLEEDKLSIYLGNAIGDGVEAVGGYKSILLDLPIGTGFGSFGPVFDVEEGEITVRNNHPNDELRVAAPQAAMAKEVEVKAEAGLTLAEMDFVRSLESLKTIESMSGSIDANAEEIQQYLKDMKIYFSRLPSGGKFRTEVMKGVVGQLGAEAERLKKAGKPEAEIFNEWLKRVFIPLYKRARKQP
jgi:hypothetical protein